MHKIFLALAILLFLTQHALAQPANESCAASGSGAVDYVQRGDDIILMECPAMEGGNAACTCHEPPGQDGTCRIYACNADGLPKEAEAKPAPPSIQEEKAMSTAKPDVSTHVKSHSSKKKTTALKKQSEAPSPPVTVIEEKKTDVSPVQDAPLAVPAAPSDKIEYSR